MFTAYPLGDESWNHPAHVLHEDRAGRLWVGADGGLFRREERDGLTTFLRIELDLSSPPAHLSTVLALMEDRDGTLWIGGSFGRLRRLPDGRQVRYVSTQVADNVRALLQDREGRIWVGCDAGLIVLMPEPLSTVSAEDGLRTRSLIGRQSGVVTQDGRIRLPSAPGDIVQSTPAHGFVGSSRVRSLYEAADGRIWIGKVSHLMAFDHGRFRTYTLEHGLSDETVNTPAEDRDGNLWIGTDLGGAMKLARNGFITYRLADGLGHETIASIFETQAGDLCVISADSIVNRLDGNRFAAVFLNLPERVADLSRRWHTPIIPDHTGEWWAGTLAGLFRFPPVARIEHLARVRPKAVYTTQDGLADDQVCRLFEDARGDIWISPASSAHGAVTRWERATGTFHRYTESDGLPPMNAPTAFGQDGSGALWLGLDGGGLARYRGGRFTLLAPGNGATTSEIVDLHLDRSGRLWAATRGNGVIRIDDPTADRPHFVRHTTADGLATNNVRCIAEDRQGRLYIGTVHGVDRLDPSTGRINHYTTADCASVSLRITLMDRQLQAEICDDGRGLAAPPLEMNDQPRQGHGLKSLQARAAELGGGLRIESAPGRGTRLIMSVPLK